MPVPQAEAEARSEVSTVNSTGSSSSRKYRVVSRQSCVDESLFAPTKSRRSRNGNGPHGSNKERFFVGNVSSLGCGDSS